MWSAGVSRCRSVSLGSFPTKMCAMQMLLLEAQTFCAGCYRDTGDVKFSNLYWDYETKRIVEGEIKQVIILWKPITSILYLCRSPLWPSRLLDFDLQSWPPLSPDWWIDPPLKPAYPSSKATCDEWICPLSTVHHLMKYCPFPPNVFILQPKID